MITIKYKLKNSKPDLDGKHRIIAIEGEDEPSILKYLLSLINGKSYKKV